MLYFIFCSIFFFLFFMQPPSWPSAIEGGKKLPRRNTPTTAVQFSGALQWAHKHHLTGKHLGAIVMEDRAPSSKFYQDNSSQVSIVPGLRIPATPTHAEYVVDVLLQIAPKSDISIVGISFSIDTAGYRLLSQKSPAFVERIKDSWVVNMSFGSNILEIQKLASDPRELQTIIKDGKYFMKRARQLVNYYGNKKLIIAAAGNSTSDLSLPIVEKKYSNQKKIYDRYVHFLRDPVLQRHLILVGNLTQNFAKNPASSYPGWNPLIQENLLYTLGTHIPSKDGPLLSGTSFSAPIVSGCVLLMKQKYPDLSIFEIKEALLESASKEFFVDLPSKGGKYRGLFVYDPIKGKPDLTQFPEDKYDIIVEAFNPKYGGRGVLNLRAAFVYAELLQANKDLPPAEIHAQMKRKLEAEEENAAKVIQTAFRNYSKKHNSKGILSSKPKIWVHKKV